MVFPETITTDVSDPFELCKPSSSKINELGLSITIYLGLCVKFYTIKLMFRIRSMCDYHRHVSYIIIKDTRGSLIMYVNYTLLKLKFTQIFFSSHKFGFGEGAS